MSFTSSYIHEFFNTVRNFSVLGSVAIVLFALIITQSEVEATNAPSWWTRPAGDPGNWFLPENWSTEVPTLIAYINNGGTCMITSGAAVSQNVYVSIDNTSQPSTLIHSDGTLTLSGGYNSLTLGSQRGTYGEYQIDGTAVLSAWRVEVGDRGVGTVLQSGGTVNANIAMAFDETATGSYEMTGGNLNAPYLEISGGGDATFNQEGGVVAATRMHVGYSFGHAEYKASGGSLTAEFFSIGTGNTWGAPRPPAGGLVTISNDAVVTADWLGIGGYGTGNLIQSGGSLTVNDELRIAVRADAAGSYSILGGSLSADELHVGYTGAGLLRVASADAIIEVDSYSQSASGQLVLEIGSNGISPIIVAEEAILAGTVNIVDTGGALGRFMLLTASEGISGDFSDVILPSQDWFIEADGTSLYAFHVPEPSSFVIFLFGFLTFMNIALRRNPV